MGLYTKLRLDITLKADTPEYARHWLNWLVNLDLIDCEEALPLHPFWYHNPRARFVGCSEATDPAHYEFPKLKIRCEVRNHGSLLNKFLDWLAPFAETVELGEYHYEEWFEPAQVTITQVDGENRFVITGKDLDGHGDQSKPFSKVVPHFKALTPDEVQHT